MMPKELFRQWTIARDTQDTMKILVGTASSAESREMLIERTQDSTAMLTPLLLLEDYRHEKNRKSANGFLC